MKSLYAFFLLLVVSSCASSKSGVNENLLGDWELSFFPTTGRTFDEVFSSRRPQLSFDLTKSRVSGSTGCNRLAGNFTVSNNHFSFGPGLSLTKMACPGYDESIFLNALRNVNRYEVIRGQLRLLHDENLLMTFKRKSAN